MRRFFWKDIKTDNVIKGEEAGHISRVLRMRANDRILVFDGSGKDYLCEITNCGKNEVEVEIIEEFKNDKKLDFSLTLYQSVIKKDNMELALQKAVEIGADSFCAFISERTVKRPDDIKKITDKYERTAKEAAKQCGRALIPKIGFLNSIKELEQRVKKHELCLIAYENEDGLSIKNALKDTKAKDIAIIIGPEGGFEKEEVELLKNAGAVSCGLGKLILRAETAAIATMAMIVYEKMEI